MCRWIEVQVREQFTAYNHDTDATNNVTMAAINTNILIVETSLVFGAIMHVRGFIHCQ